MKRLLVLLLLLVAQVLSKGEVLNKKIVVAPITPRCKGRLPTACVKPTAFAKVDADHVPSDYQCPCEVVNAGDGTNGGIEGATGIPVQNNDDQDFFVDEVLASGFDSPVAVAFADNDRNMFVGERGGKVWNVDLSTGSKVVALDFNKRVGFSGDRGLMDIKVHPNYKEIAHLMVMFTCDHDEEDGKEPDAESAQNQKIVRVDIDKVTGIHPAGPNNLEAEIIGGVNRPGGYKSGVPLCYNTHALGEMFFGHDATLMVTTGEGAHWNFDMGDWGQDADGRVADGGGRIDSLDAQCAQVFGPDQDVGSWRSQILNSLAGKILRITPDTGEGICAGSTAGSTYMPRNPFCNGLTDNGSSDKSKVWATGLRNPFRMTMRPFNPLKDSEPGVFYFGDVGQGGYEEVNAVTKPGMNFGWPCWEGPLPSPMMRDSIYNDDPNHTFDRGCGGSAAVVAPCKPITTVAYDEDGIRLTCPHMYKNKTTTLPFLYWTRYRANDNAGYFTENAYTGQGFYGATTAGLAFYSGKKYPTKYQGKLFALDFTEKWIKVIDHEDDQYISTMHFAELIHTLPTAGAKVTLASGPDGNICYLTMNGGEVRCFRYVSTNVAPVPIASAVETAVNADNAQIQFSADGTADREGDEIAFLWNFGDGSTSSKANPLHTYVTKGTYTATLTATDSNGNKAMVSIPIITNNARPKVSITSPIPNLPGNLYQLGTGSVTFDMNVVDETPATGLTYYWEYKFVHNSHQHDKIGEQFTKSFTVATLPDESAVERNSLKIVATATDASGVAGSAWIMIARPDWMTAFGNKAPVAQFVLNIPTGIARVGQPVTFDARQTLDPNGDYLTLTWSWGDGLFGTGLLTSHTYDVANPAGYTVKLNVSDNWGYSDSYTLTVPVTAAQAISPSSSIPSGPVYDDVNIVLSSIEPGSVIYYELFQGNPNGTDVTPASTIYTGPIKLSYTAGVTANLLIKARSSSGGVPSDTVRYTYDMVPPPCTTMGLGAAGSNTAPGSAFCINPLNPGVPSAVVNIPPKDPWNGQVFTDAPPPSEPNGTKVIVFMMNGLNGTPAPAGTLTPKYATTFPNIWVNSGSAVGAIAKMMIEYDWTGDGTYDRREVFINYAPDPDPTTWESSEIMFQRESNKFIPTSPTGTAYRAFANGNIKISIWEAISENAGGNDPLQFRTGNNTYDAATQLNQMSTIQFPYSSLYVAQNRAPGTPLPTPPPAYSGTDGWPTQPPVNTAVNTDQSRSSAVTSNAVGTSAGTSGTAGTTAGTAGTSATGTGAGTGTNTAATSMIGASSASSNSTSGASAGSQAASRGAEGTTSNSNIIVCSFFLIVLALL